MSNESGGSTQRRGGWRRRRRAERVLVSAARRAGVRDARVLEAVEATPRSAYVPASLVGDADADEPLPIGEGQTTSQPSLIALMVEALEVDPSDRVLEVGTGFGWQTALLAQLASEVVSIERHASLAEEAAERLAGFPHVRVVVGDGFRGVPAHAPYDAVIVSAATPSVPEALEAQLADGGRLVAPVGAQGHQVVVRYVRRDNALVRDRELTAARFVPLVPDESGGGEA
ncbi:protein-L-isoaspartate(D-aspartate) O-methyltransferase [Egibacter rhizosphaerae]|uniref:Protein-L-isoaspartate O-methyltransferase n=1 Tax=Egibacter rhizosphaerae TaxID=1670831 RepID=A0A411YHZ8_9ACTN|nr:protein-L-isoaspartate(D-aspartate) O-methyltransferase [Egibacter rhizosphaerae]QBI20955.1 protein-L-isoaspartate(D-aspartate) O-methyltransferase [Egibacter rhizosphaerae]